MAPGVPVTLFRLAGYVGGEPGQPMPRDVVAVMTSTGSDSSAPMHWNVNLRVDDTDAVAAHTAQLGDTVLMAPMDTPGFRSAVVLDPHRALFSISQLATRT
jgi:predicted enzyme related to lactoylglutathione lyase